MHIIHTYLSHIYKLLIEYTEKVYFYLWEFLPAKSDLGLGEFSQVKEYNIDKQIILFSFK